MPRVSHGSRSVRYNRASARTSRDVSAVVRKLAEGAVAWALPWPCIYEFFSVVTNRKIWKDAASSPQQAWSQIEAWLDSPSLQLLAETDQFHALLGRLLCRPRVRGPVVHDARIAALCLVHGVEALVTRDRDFSLFRELETRDPFRMSAERLPTVQPATTTRRADTRW